MKLSVKLIGLALVLCVLVQAGFAEGQSEKSEVYPSKTISFLVPANPGGGWDLTSRAMKKVLEETNLVDQNIVIVNKPGGSGEVAWQFLKNQDSYTLSINSALILNNYILGVSKLTYQDFTPIATISAGWEALVVPVNSPYQTAEEFMAQLEKNPSSLKIGVFGLGNNAHLTFVKAAMQYGVDISKIEYLVEKSGANIVTQLAGNHMQGATMYAAEATDLYKAGKVKILAVASEDRMEDLPEVPTWKELGGVSIAQWRGFMGPPNMTSEAIAYWDNVFSKMVKTPEWKAVLKQNQWSDYYKDSSETAVLLEENEKIYRELIEATGMNK